SHASTSLRAPMATVTPMPIFHASTGSPVTSIAGPRTPNTMPKSEGVSIPKGMAVTSSRPEARASRIASHVYTRSPMSTPAAVPGQVGLETGVGGKLEDPDERAGEDEELRGVGEGEPEERVDVSGREPAWPAAPRRHARRIFAGLPPSSRERALGRDRRGPDT